MFRIKITAMLTLVILMVMTITNIFLPKMLAEDANQKARASLQLAAQSMARAERLNGFSVVARAQEIAAFPGLKTSLTDEYEEPYDYNRHLGVYNKGLLRWQYVFSDIKERREGQPAVAAPLRERPPYTPDLFFVADDKGIGVAALGPNKYEWYKGNVAKQHPTLMSVADGQARQDIWFWRWDDSDKGSFYQVGIAPVMQGPEKMLGVVVLGRQISPDAAREASAHLGGHGVAFFADDRIIASTFNKAEDEAIVAATLKADGVSLSDDAIPVTIKKRQHLARVSKFYNQTNPKQRTGFIVLHNVSADMKLVRSIESGILIGGLSILILLLVSVLVVIRSFVKPFEEIDQGIQEVLAGNKDYLFPVHDGMPFQASIAQSLNLMSAYLQGKRMPDEDDDAEAWGDFLVGDVTGTAMMRAIKTDSTQQEAEDTSAPTPATREPEDEYKQRIFQEYVQARKSLGMDAEELTLEAFDEKLERHAASLRQKHKAREVRFSVVVREGKVVLKPQPIF